MVLSTLIYIVLVIIVIIVIVMLLKFLFGVLFILPANATFWSTRDATNYSETGTEDCPMLPSSETSQALPQMKCHDPECRQYFMGNNYTGTNKTMEEKCWKPAVDRSIGSLAAKQQNRGMYDFPEALPKMR